MPKLRLVGERLMAGAIPVPVKLATCGLPLALSAMLSEAVRVPVAAGVKVTLIVQLLLGAVTLPAGRPEPQLLVWENSVEEVEMVEIVKAALPVLVSVMVCAALVVPTS